MVVKLNKVLIGLDIGGTYVRSLLVKDNKISRIDIIKNKFVRTGNLAEEININVCSVIDFHLKNIDKYGQFIGICISLAALTNRETGIITIWPNNRVWNDFSIKSYLQEKYNVPIFIEDDANCAALGEYLFNYKKYFKNMVCITVGTGIGCGIILNGGLYIGDDGLAGELGHTCINKESEQCTCGQKGCLQSLVSGSSLITQYARYSNRNLQGIDELINLMNEGDVLAKNIINKFITNMAQAIYNIAMILNITYFVIGGGVLQVNYNFIELMQNEINYKMLYLKRSVVIKKSVLGDNSGVIGAASLTGQKNILL